MRTLDLRVVLTRTIYQRNIGACARALHNMGGERLILVDPRCRLSEEAKMAAASAQKVLSSIVTYQDWDSFYAEEPRGLSFAFTARDGTDRRVRPFPDVLRQFAEEHPALTDAATPEKLVVHLVFGPEDAGLAAEDLRRLQSVVSLPTWGENPSMNLAQAVLVAMFIVQDRWGTAARPPRDAQTVALAESGDFPEDSLRRWLEVTGFTLDDHNHNAFTMLRRLILRAGPTAKELQTFEGALRRSLKKMESADEGLP